MQQACFLPQIVVHAEGSCRHSFAARLVRVCPLGRRLVVRNNLMHAFPPPTFPLQLMPVDITVFHFESNESSKPKLPILCFFQPAPPINITHDRFLTCVVVGNRQRALQLFPTKQHICEVEHQTQHITSNQAHQSRLVIFLVAATALFYLFGFDSQASAISIDTKRGDICRDI